MSFLVNHRVMLSGIKRLKEEFLANNYKVMAMQNLYFGSMFNNWKWKHWQMDGVLLVGAKI